MSKRLIIAVLAVSFVLMTGCSSVKTVQSEQDETTRIQPDSAYKIVDAKYTAGNVTIRYPQLSGLEDAAKQQSINNRIRNESLKVLQYYTEPDHKGIPDDLSLNIAYNIALSRENLLSIRYFGEGYAAGAAHPNNLFYTTNIDLAQGTQLRLKDVVSIDDHFIDNLLNGNFTVAENTIADKSDIVAALKSWSATELRQQLNNADSLDDIGTERQSDIFTYITEDSVGISIPVSHAIGDHAELEMKNNNL